MAEQLILDLSETEDWRVIVGDPNYEVGSLGRVRRATDSFYPNSVRLRTTAGRILTLSPDGSGRLRVTLTAQNKRIRVATLVCTAFHGHRPSPKHVVAHWDGNNQNNVPNNVRWATHKENNEDSVRLGEKCRGERHGCAKLRAIDIPVIFGLLAEGWSQQRIADKFGVSRSSVQCIKDGRSYAYRNPSAATVGRSPIPVTASPC